MTKALWQKLNKQWKIKTITNNMKNNIYKSIPYIIFVGVAYLVLLVVVHEQYPYIYTDLFVDEWVVIAVATAIYTAIVGLLTVFINYIRKSEERKRQLAFGSIAIGVLIAIFAVMKKYVDYQEAERQRQLEEAERNSKLGEEAHKRIERMYIETGIEVMKNNSKK